MSYYVILFSLCIIIYLFHRFTNNKTIKSILEIITIVILALFSGTRYRLGGSDYEIYEKAFNLAPTLLKFDFNGNYLFGFETGYMLLNSLIKSLGFNFYGFTLIHSILFYFLLYKAMKRYDVDFSFFIIVFLYKSCIFNTFVSMRQSLVIVIFLYALSYLKDGNWKRYLLMIIPCYFFHSSSLILLPIVFLRNKSFTKKFITIYGLVFLAFLLLNITHVFIFNPSNLIYSIFGGFGNLINKADFYINSVSNVSVNLLSSIETYAVWILVVLFYNRVYLKSNESKTIINTFLLIIPIVTLFRNFEIMIRIRDYFSILFPIVLYYLYSIFEKKSRLIYVMILFSLSFLGYYRYIYTYDEGEYSLKNYESYVFKDISIFNN